MNQCTGCNINAPLTDRAAITRCRSIQRSQSAMNTCIKTGADVWLLPHTELVHGDLFEMNEVYALHRCKGSTPVLGGVRYNVRFNLDDAGWNIIETGDFIIIPKQCCSDFSYEGWTV